MITHYVYRLDAFGGYYFGFTKNPDNRLWGHLKSMRFLLKEGSFELASKYTGHLHFHHFVAKSMYDKKLPSSSLKYNVKISIIYSSQLEKDAIDVETFLIIKSMKDKKCYNKRIVQKK